MHRYIRHDLDPTPNIVVISAVNCLGRVVVSRFVEVGWIVDHRLFKLPLHYSFFFFLHAFANLFLSFLIYWEILIYIMVCKDGDLYIFTLFHGNIGVTHLSCMYNACINLISFINFTYCIILLNIWACSNK